MLGVFLMSLIAISTLVAVLIAFHVFVVTPLKSNEVYTPHIHQQGMYIVGAKTGGGEEADRHVSVGGHHLNLGTKTASAEPDFSGPGQDELDDLTQPAAADTTDEADGEGVERSFGGLPGVGER